MKKSIITLSFVYFFCAKYSALAQNDPIEIFVHPKYTKQLSCTRSGTSLTGRKYTANLKFTVKYTVRRYSSSGVVTKVDINGLRLTSLKGSSNVYPIVNRSSSRNTIYYLGKASILYTNTEGSTVSKHGQEQPFLNIRPTYQSFFSTTLYDAGTNQAQKDKFSAKLDVRLRFSTTFSNGTTSTIPLHDGAVSCSFLI